MVLGEAALVSRVPLDGIPRDEVLGDLVELVFLPEGVQELLGDLDQLLDARGGRPLGGLLSVLGWDSLSGLEARADFEEVPDDLAGIGDTGEIFQVFRFFALSPLFFLGLLSCGFLPLQVGFAQDLSEGVDTGEYCLPDLDDFETVPEIVADPGDLGVVGFVLLQPG